MPHLDSGLRKAVTEGYCRRVLQIIEITIVSGMRRIRTVADVPQNLMDDEHQTYLTNIVWLPQSTGMSLTPS